MWATRVIILALILAIGIAFQGIACGQTPGFTGITTDTAWIGPDNGVTVGYTLTDATCCDVYLFVYDPSYAPVRTIHAGLQSSGTYSIYWDGCLEDGTHVPEGLYTLQVGAIDFGRVPDTLANQWIWTMDPCGVSADASGNVYVIDPDTLQLFGADGNDATLLQWDESLTGMAVDTSGNVYAVDKTPGATPGTIYLIGPGGSATVVATGLGEIGAIAVNATGYLYVACASDYTLRMISPDGTVTVIGVCPPTLTAMTVGPDNIVYMVGLEGDLTVVCPDGISGTLYRGLVGTSGIAVDADGNIYVSTLLDHSVKKITPDLKMVTLNSQFKRPAGLCADSFGNVYVIDQGELISVPQIKFVYVIHPDGTMTRVGPGFSHTSHLAVNDPGTFYVSDYTGQIKKVTGSGVTTVLDSSYYQPSIAVDACGVIYISDKFQSSIMALLPDGRLATLGDGFRFPMGLAVDAEGNVYVADTFNSLVKVIKTDGTIATIGTDFVAPWDVAVDAMGNVYVADGIDDGTVTKVCPDGTQIALAHGYDCPDSIAVDAGGIIYFTDNGNTTVKAIYPDGTIVTIAQFQYLIYDLAVDTAGNLYVDCLEGIYMLSRPTVAGSPCTVYSDMTPPVTTCELSGTMDSGSYLGTVQVSLSATDAGSGVKTTTCSVDGGAWETYTAPFDITGDGHHTVNYRSTDNVGNVEQIEATSFAIGIPVAMFTVNVTSGEAPLCVHFIDQSTGNPNYWLWDLGTGAHSWSINPVYTYTTPGTYTVSLTVSNGFTSDTVTKTGLITVYRATKRFDIPLKQGWNLISIPLQTDAITASSLSALGVTEVAWYDASAGDYNVYLVGLTPDDFSLSPNQGYFLYCSQDSTLSVTGYPPSGWTETLQAGWNMIGWGTLKTVEASVVASSLPGSQEIARYNTASGMFDIYLEGRTPVSFPMKPGEGYFIYTPEAGMLDYDSLGGA